MAQTNTAERYEKLNLDQQSPVRTVQVCVCVGGGVCARILLIVVYNCDTQYSTEQLDNNLHFMSADNHLC